VPGLRFVVPFGREGASDRAARAFARSLSFPRRREPRLDSRLRGNDTDIENLPGAGGLRGVRRANELARRGEPVLLLGTPTTHVLLAARLGEAEAPDEVFEPLLGLGSAPNVLLVSPALTARSVAELISSARQKPLTYASAGAGQTIHLCSALFCAQARIRMAHRPYDGGSATAYDDLAAGRVHVFFDSLLGCRDRIEQGDAIALAVSSRERNALLPDVPTLIESGFPGHCLDVWLGVFGANLDARTRQAIDALQAGAPLAASLRAIGLRGGPSSGSVLRGEIAVSAPRWLDALAAAIDR
jgi:tripartite-type tricarboxylate transporter receptor subunit TctC